MYIAVIKIEAFCTECWMLTPGWTLAKVLFPPDIIFSIWLVIGHCPAPAGGATCCSAILCHLARDVQQTKECKIFATNWIFSSLILATPHQQVELSIRSDLTPAPDSILRPEANIRQSWLRSHQDCIQYCIGFIEVLRSISRRLY